MSAVLKEREEQAQVAPSALPADAWQLMCSPFAEVVSPPPIRYSDEWANDNRILPPGSAEPGEWRSERTPYMIPIVRAFSDHRYHYVCAIMGAQMGKTDNLFNVAGHRLDDDPAPVLYVGPTQSNIQKVIEPRVMKMLRSVPQLYARLAKGKGSQKTYKSFGDIAWRLAWAGSATELASDPVALALVDELDRMDRDIGGEGDPLELVEARTSTYPDGKVGVTSTPTVGNVDVEKNERTGFEHWKVANPDDIDSPIWKLWQQGTRFEWAWPCPECKEYFIPRFKQLWFPEKASPQVAYKEARVACPHCACLIGEEHKSEMNARGVFVAPGQWVLEDGTVCGDIEETDVASFWVSGLCSPWRSFGHRARDFVRAKNSGEPGKVQAVINTRFGELFKVAGEAPDWQLAANLRADYDFDANIEDVQVITCGVDVQKNRLIYSIRGWGYGMTSWQLRHDEIWGETEQDEVWDRLADLLTGTEIGGKRITLMNIDSGYRPGDKYKRPDNQIYKFCRRFKGWARATKGHETQDRPVKMSKIDITVRGKVLKKGLDLWHINTDHFKSWVYGRIEWPTDQPGAFLLSRETTDDYCMQLTAEARVTKPSGHFVWVRIRQDNHYLDCEVLNVAAAYMLQLHMLRQQKAEADAVKDKTPSDEEATQQDNGAVRPSRPRTRPETKTKVVRAGEEKPVRKPRRARSSFVR